MKWIVCVCGAPRSGSNLVAAMVHALGYPCRPGCGGEMDDMMPTGSYHDNDFATGKVQRAAPWVFKCHGWKYENHEARFLKRKDLRVIATSREVSAIEHSVRRCVDLNRAGKLVWGKIQLNKSEEFVTQLWLTRHWRFLMRYEGEVLHLNYDSVVDNPKQAVDRLANFIDVDASERAVAMVDPALRHFRGKAGRGA